MKTIWTKQQLAFLRENYEKLKTEELLKILTNKTNNQLRWKAKEFGLRKRVSRSKTDMTFLENMDNSEICYWWGFITADGCINEKSIILAIQESDLNHLEKFCRLSKSRISKSTRINPWHKTPYTMVRTAIEDKFTLPKLKEKLKIIKQKTYNPFDISTFLTSERLIYFLAGLIDGDGHISDSPSISIKCHPNWHSNFRLISAALAGLYQIKSTVNIQNDGWLVLRICGKKQLILIYNKIKDKTPYLERKWVYLRALSLIS